MNIKDIELRKGMSKEDVNELIGEWITLEDNVYEGNAYKHNWKCKCGNIIKGRMWSTITKRTSSQSCIKCNRLPIEIKHRYEIEKDDEYEYIKTLYTGDELLNGKIINRTTYVEIKHKYCGCVYFVEARCFIDKNHRCQHCCGNYENSFAYHIEVELGLKLEDVWDFERNAVNPHYISKNTNASNRCGENLKVFIKCQEKDYHDSYEIACNNFVRGSRCVYCASKIIHEDDSFAKWCIDNIDKDFLEKYWDYDKNEINPFQLSQSNNKKVWIKCQEKDYHGSYEVSCGHFINNKRCSYCYGKKVHPKDSFAQYHIDNTDHDFLEKYWDYDKNTVDPWDIKPSSLTKIWIKCQNEDLNMLNKIKKKDYHGSYMANGCDFTSGKRCSYCNPTGKNPKVHPYDSFGYHNFDKVQSWHPDNEISPFKVSCGTKNKYKLICFDCDTIFNKRISNIHHLNQWCPECSMSEGEKKIAEWLRYNGIEYEYEKEYDGLVGVGRRSLSYDFNLADYNMLIEFQGEQHEKFLKGLHINYNKFEKQQEHDRRKREYAEKNGIELLEIWYWEFDNIEEILNKELINSNKLI